MNNPEEALTISPSVENPLDQLFLSLINDLAADIVKDTQAAAEKTIDLSSQFLDSESQRLLENYQVLCCDKNTETGELLAADEETNDSVKVMQDSLQSAITKDAAVRSEINTIMGAMQFSELLRQHLVGLCATYKILINESDLDTDSLKQKMLEDLHTVDERKAFYEQVLHQEMPDEDAEIDQDLIDQLLGNSNG